jgi:hypothetical protein
MTSNVCDRQLEDTHFQEWRHRSHAPVLNIMLFIRSASDSLALGWNREGLYS